MRTKLLIQAIRFNGAPAIYADASWFAPWLTPARLAVMRRQTDAARTLNRFLLEQLEPIEPVDPEAFSDPLLQLLTQTTNTSQLTMWAGLALHHLSLKRIICGRRQRELKVAFGENGYCFALERAQFMMGAACDPIPALTDEDTLAVYERVQSAGVTLLATASVNLPESVQKRLPFFFPKQYAHCFTGLHTNDEIPGMTLDVNHPDAVEKARGLLFKIAQEIIPSWKPVSF
ncbi:SctK family type III secretion system sorting platform protein [Hahella aquimaris]|uniref:SctK family type III secretion system sorting platform protein n=1 Tax=Hahella sp. HNIBRBA332 TaxID=3015983 RepID=UPI00273CD674|nr:SctK family type III secretion system sorting platform protein [Hahella sp. HNIBRBA332]WLQ16247.1 SctK family type III secretion system sorting platform protein [Hahella sp. HNIBRBA332]